MNKEQEAYARELAPKAAALVPAIVHTGVNTMMLTGLTRDDVRVLLGARTALPLALAEIDRLRAEGR